MAQASSRPPRILFIVEKMTDAFLRRIKQLSYLEIDCFEFRHLEVNGASVVYFDLVERLRKAVADSTVDGVAEAPVVAPPTSEARVEPRVEAVRVESVRVAPVNPVVERPAHVEWRESVSEPKPVDPPKAVAEPIRFEPAAVAVIEAEPEPEPVAPIVAAPSAQVPLVDAPHAIVEVQAPPVVA